MHDGWPHKQSPFHMGEQQVQQRVGVRDQIEGFARRVVRDHMPDEHRDFFEMLPYVILSTLDEAGWPWASMVVGQPGFMTSPDARHLDIAAMPLLGDPLADTLKPGAHIGILGIELASRRRNRISGRIETVRPDGFVIAVDQAYGNCPQYIQAREVTTNTTRLASTPKPVITNSHVFDDAMRTLIETSDTLFIATAYVDGDNAPSEGLDSSHRGGKPGFVRVENERTFVFPDFFGNNHFNTVGNIVMNPKAGFLFVNFDSGDLLYVTGRAEIVWDGREVQAFAGAQRFIRLHAEQVIRVQNSLPLQWNFGGYSPSLLATGSWEKTYATIATETDRNTYFPLEVFKIVRESNVISSFYLRRSDRKPVQAHEPGQFLPIKLTIPGQDAPATRTYTISTSPNAEHYRLSIKREAGEALVSNFLHDNAKPGFQLQAMAPRGKFVLDRSSDRPVVLLSAGIGITPMIAMMEKIINDGLETASIRRTYFIHGARNGPTHAFSDQVRRLAEAHDTVHAHIRYSRPGTDDRLGETHDSAGHVDIALLRELLPFDDYEFYLCGPQPFMQMLYDGLIEIGVRDERIHYESFGPATVLKHDTTASMSSTTGEPVKEPVPVCFADSDIEAEWTPDKGTLLELAEDAGLTPSFSCRSGQCGTCATRLLSGEVEYLEEPTAPREDDEVLICCATPRPRSGNKSCGKDCGVVIDL